LQNRLAIAADSLCNHCAFVLGLLRNRFTIAPQSLICGIASQLLYNPYVTPTYTLYTPISQKFRNAAAGKDSKDAAPGLAKAAKYNFYLGINKEWLE
jgi:hypothetical protein